MVLGFRKFISEVFVNGKFPKILPSENFTFQKFPAIWYLKLLHERCTLLVWLEVQ